MTNSNDYSIVQEIRPPQTITLRISWSVWLLVLLCALLCGGGAIGYREYKEAQVKKEFTAAVTQIQTANIEAYLKANGY